MTVANSPELRVEREEGPGKGRYFVRIDGVEAEMTYSRAGEGMIIVAETQLRYLKPARLDDQLRVTVAVTDVGRASVTFAQEVWRSDTLLTQGMVRIGWVHPLTPRGEPVLAGAGRVDDSPAVVVGAPAWAPVCQVEPRRSGAAARKAGRQTPACHPRRRWRDRSADPGW